MTSFADPGSGPSGDESRNVRVNLDADVSGYTQQVAAAQQQTAAMAGSVDTLATSMSSLAKAAGRKLFHFAAADFAGLSVAVADAASLERQLSTLTATSVVTGTSMSAMKDQLDDAFAKFPVARAQIVQLAETITNLGVKAPNDVRSAVGTFLKLGVATGESAVGLASGSLQLNRQMGNTDPGQVEGYANSLLTVSKNQGVATSGVLEFSQAIAPMSRAAGIGQAAVMGIAAAFQKAGADGGYAANTFNKIITDISTLSQTGSPELAKYSNFVGKSLEEFKAMSGTDQATSVFSQIGKGGPQALSFMSSIGLGPRDTRAVQAVAQSGSLTEAIAQARGSAGDNKNLETASAAAFSGLSDSLVSVGNKFTQLGETIGEPLLGPLAALAQGFAWLMDGVNKIVKSMGPIPAIVAGIAGSLAIPAALVMGHMGTIGALALGRTLLGPNSMGRIAMREGRAAGVAMRASGGTLTQAQAMGMSRSGQRVAAGMDPNNPAGRANLRTSVPYNMGLAQGQRGSSGSSGIMGRVGGLAGQGIRTVVGTGTWVTNMQTQGNRDSYVAGGGPNRSGNLPPDPRMAWRANVQNAGVRSVRQATTGLIGSTVIAGGSMAAAATGGITRAAARALRREGEAARASFGMGAPTRAAAAGIAGAANVGGLASRGVGMVARGAGMAAGAMFSLPGMLALMIGVPLISKVVSAIKEGNAARADISGSLSGAAKYDQALDKASTNLAKFGQTVDAAANKLAAFANTPIKDITTVTDADIAAAGAGDYKQTDPNLQPIVQGAALAANAPGGDPDSLRKATLAYLNAQGIQDPSAMGDKGTKLKQDILNAYNITGPGGNHAQAVTDVFNEWVNQPGGTSPTTPNLNILGSVGGTPGFGTATAGIDAGTQGAGVAGQKIGLAGMAALGATSTGAADAGQSGRIRDLSTGLLKTFGIDPKEFQTQLGLASDAAGTEVRTGTRDRPEYNPYSTPEQALPQIIHAIAGTEKGKALMAANDWKEEDLLTMAQNPMVLPPVTTSQTASQLKTHGSLGQWLGGEQGASFQEAATGSKTGQAGAGFAAVVGLVGEAAEQSGGSLANATGRLMALSDAMGGMSDPTGALIKSAADWQRQLQSFVTPTMSREGQLTEATRTAAASATAAAIEGASTDTVNQSHADKTALEGQKESYRQYMISRIVQGKAFVVSQERATEDYNLQVAHSNRDFQIQQLRGEEDYNTSRLRSQEDFQIQSQRSMEDYQLSVTRSNADHARDLKRQAASAAQDIYDPFLRTQKKATTDAGTLIYNLKQQNTDIERQLKQIQQLKDQGLSQGSIDTLKLTDAGNAQQVDALMQSLQQNPNMTGQINDLIGQRLSDTTKLTQSPDSVAFRQSQEDYYLQMSRGADDFAKSQSRAADDVGKSLSRTADDFAKSQGRLVDDQVKALSDMAVAFGTTQSRAGEDLVTSFKQYTGDFATIMNELTTTAVGSVQKWAPEVGALMTGEINTVVAQNPWIKGAAYTVTVSPGTITTAPTPGAAGVGKLQKGGRDIGRTVGGFAYGGISLTQQQSLVSEHGPEAHIPLNSRGENFMAGLIARAMVQGVTTATSAAPSATSMSNDNSVSFAGADIKVVASDPNQMARELAAKAKLGRLTSPVRH